MTITIATGGHQALRDGIVQGGGPVVARRQALALARCGVKARLLDIEPGKAARHLEAWSWSGGGVEVEVNSWQGPINTAAPYLPESVRAVANIIEQNGKEDFLFVQEDGFGTVAEAAKALARHSVYQPNDYGFLCGRAWFLRGDGRRCDMLPAPGKCAHCQLTGRTLGETFALKGFYLGETLGLRLAPIFALRTKSSVRGGESQEHFSILRLFQMVHSTVCAHGRGPEAARNK